MFFGPDGFCTRRGRDEGVGERPAQPHPEHQRLVLWRVFRIDVDMQWAAA